MKWKLLLLVLLPSTCFADVVYHAPATAEKKAVVRKGYPIRSSWWTGCGSWQHLAVGEHIGKFDQTWLKSLSNEEIQSLHSDDHEKRVKWEFVVRPQVQKVQATTQPQMRLSVRTDCPNGKCPK